MTCSSTCGFRRLLDVGRVVYDPIFISVCAGLDHKSSCGAFRTVRSAKKGSARVEWAVRRIFLAYLTADSTFGIRLVVVRAGAGVDETIIASKYRKFL